MGVLSGLFKQRLLKIIFWKFIESFIKILQKMKYITQKINICTSKLSTIEGLWKKNTGYKEKGVFIGFI